MRDCAQSHRICNAGNDETKPRRLIKINSHTSPPELNLQIDEIERVQYVALSHCWGAHQPLRTTHENVLRLKNCITWSLLPRCFQDAISLTMQLGLSYIWIDSICIVQDDKDDWAVESERMGAIYGNAFLVISAARAANSNQGLFSSHLGKGQQILETGFSQETLPSKILIRRNIQHEQFIQLDRRFNWDLKEPLLDRAWAFQERLFAKRVVHFAADELVWECNSEAKCQCSGSWVFQQSEYFKLKWARTIQHQEADVGADTEEDMRRMSSWWDVVEAFSGRKLTYKTDKLPAISAAARQFSSFGLGRYIAGMWENYLLQSLLWACDSYYTPLSRDHYSAPTWSWASVQTPVNRPPSLSDINLCIVVRTDCVPTTTTGYGQVSLGAITLKGIILQTQIHPSASQGRRKYCLQNVNFLPDVAWTGDPTGMTVYCLMIAKSSLGSICCLVLRHEAQLGLYYRIGTISLQLMAFSRQAREETIIII
jgi:hypothetical protein